MTKREFLKELRSRLGQLSDVERDQVLLYWSEAIDDRLESGMTEERIFAELESPDVIALRILSELHNSRTASDHIVMNKNDDDDDDDEDDDDDDEDDDDEDDDEDEESGFHFHIPEIYMPETNISMPSIPAIPELHIPEMKIPDIHIPEIRVPESKGDGWYVGGGPDGPGYYATDGAPKRRKLQAKAETVRELQIHDRNNRIELRPSSDGQLTVGWTENKYHKYDVTAENGVLTVTYRAPNILERIFNAMRREPVVVGVPAGYAGLINANTVNGGIEAETLHLTGQLKLQTTNGSIGLEDIQAETVTASSTNGSIKAEQLQGQQLRLRTTNAKLKLEQVDAPVVDLGTTNAKIDLESVRADTLTAGTSNSAISVDQIDAQQVRLRTSNGSISGRVAGSAADYTISSGTSNGKNNIPSRAGGQRTLEAHTSNGSIKIEFAND